MEVKHTPGPWRTEQMDFPHQPRVHCGEGGEKKLIACVGNAEDWELASAEWNANAHLIAAAPDLLYAAKLGLSTAEDWIIDQLEGTSSFKEEMEKLQPIRNAIGKVGGLS